MIRCFHTTVLGILSKNLDPFFSEKDQVRKLFQFDNSYDISVIEGAMGLYDGLGELQSRHLLMSLQVIYKHL